MALSSSINYKSYVAAVDQTVFPFTEILYFNESHLEVWVDGVKKTLGSDYTCWPQVNTSNGDPGGTITFLAGMVGGEVVLIKRVVPLTQTTDYQENEKFPAETHEQGLDHVTMICQQLNEESNRSVKLPVGETGTSASTLIPALSSRANKYAAWNASGEFISLDAATASGTSVTSTGSTTARILADRFHDYVNVLDYGAVPDGVTDSSAAFTAAFAASGNCVWVPGGVSSFYMVKNVTIPSGKTLLSDGAYFKDLAGASYIFKLTGYSTRLEGAYISRASNCSVGALVVDSGNKVSISNVRIIDATSGIVLQATGSPTNTTQTSLHNIRVDSFTGVGIDIKKDVSNTNASDIWCDANAIAGGGGLIPRPGSTGFRQTGTGSTTAYGGHNWTNCVAINCETGWRFDTSNLTKLNNCASDSCSGRGISIAGASDYIDISDHFIGVCGRGFEIANTSTRCSLIGFRTNDTGVIPGWGGTTFYSSASPAYSAPFYDIAVLDTAKCFVDGSSWYAGGSRAITEASGAQLNLSGDDAFHSQSIGTIAAGATQYLGINEEKGTEQPTVWRAPCAGTVVRLFVAPTNAPGAAQTFTYTLRKNFADTSLVATCSGAGAFGATAYGQIVVGKGDTLCTKLVTSAGAAVTHHNVSFIFLKTWG